MISYNRIATLRDKCLTTIRTKTEQAEASHDWVVDAHTLSSWELLELLRFAQLGFEAWQNEKQ